VLERREGETRRRFIVTERWHVPSRALDAVAGADMDRSGVLAGNMKDPRISPQFLVVSAHALLFVCGEFEEYKHTESP
jgi:hypothetical protein